MLAKASGSSSKATWTAREFFAGIYVGEGLRLVVEGHLDAGQRPVPALEPALAARQVVCQVRQDFAPAEAEHRMRLIAGTRHGNRRLLGIKRRQQAGDQIHRQERRVTGRGGHEGRRRCR